MSFYVINPNQTFYDSTGTPRAGGFVTFFVNTTSTKGSIYSDEALTVAQANPYELDASGRILGDVKYSGLMTMQATNADGSDVRTDDNVSTVEASGIRADLASITVATLGSFLVGVFLSVTGYVGRTLSSWISSRSYFVDDFGAVGDGITVDTAGIQAALDIAPRVLEFSPGKTYALDEVEIKGPIHIKLNGCILKPSGGSIFAVRQNIAGTVTIEGVASVDWGSPTGTVGKEFFHNISDGGDGSTGYHLGTEYDITKLIIRDNVLGISKITSLGDTEAHIIDNNWTHVAGVASAPYYLLCSRGTTDDLKGPVLVRDNLFDVYPPNGSNVDIVKLTGGITKALFTGNVVSNRNTACAAMVDLFSAGHKVKVIGNDFTNIEVHLKQVKGSIPAAPVYQQYSIVTGNVWDMEDGFIGIRALLNEVTRGIISGNQFVMRHTTTASQAILLEASDTVMLFGSKEVSATVINANQFDMQGTAAGSHAVKHSPSTPVGKGLVLSNNLLIGAEKLVAGGTEFTSALGNVWLDSGNATGVSINGSANSVVLGNVADTTAPYFTGSSNTNKVTQELIALTAADTTPSVALGDMYKITSGSSITDFDDGYVGQTITIFGGAWTLVHGTPLLLNGAINYTTTDFGDSITLRKRDSTAWVEVGRSKI